MEHDKAGFILILILLGFIIGSIGLFALGVMGALS